MLLASAILPFGRQADAASSGIQILLDGAPVITDTEPYVLPKVNLTMVPIRVVSESLKAVVDWKQSAKTVSIAQSGKVITMVSGQKFAYVNGSKVPLDAPTEVKNGRVMVPLRFVSENLGVQVDWNSKTRIIALTTTNPSGGGSAADIRGAWISTVYNLDWPSTSAYSDPAKQQAEFAKLLDDLQAVGMNSVFVQVRSAGDALYPSQLVPWSKVLTGTQGQDPGYDPLTYMIEEAHKRGMQFHAWFNPFRANTDTTTNGLAANHVALQHPDWIVKSGTVSYIDPGIPDARQHIVDAIMEVVNNYPIDGVHLDDYFYPSGTDFNDSVSYLAYNPNKLLTKAEWRRDNINQFVKLLDDSIHKAKPRVSFGISPFGVWRNASDDPTGSDTKAGVTAYDGMNADVRTWIRQGWLDYVAPQVYWSLTNKSAPYGTVTSWWANEVQGTDVKLYIGHAAYKVGTTESGWQSAQEIMNQLQYNKKHAVIQGDLYFRAKELLRNPLGLADLLRGYYVN
nr:family 10 glycosylhydrolase [Cohnella sp. AR92]